MDNYPEICVKISSALLGSAQLIYAQIKDDGLLLWGPDADMSPEAGWRPKRIGFYIGGILSALVFITHGYLWGCIGWTVATVQGPRPTLQEDPATSGEKTGLEKEETTQTDSNDAPLVSTEPETEAQSFSSTSAIAQVNASDSQATDCVRKVGADVRKPTGVRYGLAYLVMSVLMSRGLYQVFGESRPMQWVVHLTTSLALAGLRMLWTHALLTDPSIRLPRPVSLAYWVRIYQALLLPSLAYAFAQPATVLAVKESTGRLWDVIEDVTEKETGMAVIIALCFIMVGVGCGVAAAMIAVCVTPAIFTLNRVELSFLPKDIPTIATLYTDERRGEDASQHSDGFYCAFVAPSVQAWKGVNRRDFLAQCWLSIKTCALLCVPGSQFLQIIFQSTPAS